MNRWELLIWGAVSLALFVLWARDGFNLLPPDYDDDQALDETDDLLVELQVWESIEFTRTLNQIRALPAVEHPWGSVA